MLIPFGVLSAAGAGLGFESDYELIESVILDTATSSVLFDSLATYDSTYKHLQIRYAARSATGAAADSLALRFNGDTATNYTSHKMEGDGSSVSSSADVSANNLGLGASLPAASATANIFGVGVIDLLDTYSTTKNKTVRALFGQTGTVNRIALASGVFRVTSATSSLTLLLQSGSNLVAGTRISLYGIKG
jgi:hypothetical protein